MSMIDELEAVGAKIWFGYNKLGMPLSDLKKIANVPKHVLRKVALAHNSNEAVKIYIAMWKRLGSEQE